jgi:NAD(P)-dependent dehydrogenase (short-subunit alcohol dehydrogenase family)
MRWTTADVPDQTGRVAVITGANTGIGFGVAAALADKGAQVVLAVRDLDKGKHAASQISATSRHAYVTVQELDLAWLGSVCEAANGLKSAYPRIDLLINNAGVMFTPEGCTRDGFELQFATNHLGHFALTGLLLPRIETTPKARVINVSSAIHFTGRIDFDDLQAERSYNPTRAYGQSKLANLLFTRELQRRFESARIDALSAAAHPGSTRTGLQQHSSLMAAAVAVFSQLPPEGALPTLYAATAPDVRGGEYFGPSRWFGMLGPPERARSSPRSKDAAAAGRLWEASEKLTGVAYTF